MGEERKKSCWGGWKICSECGRRKEGEGLILKWLDS